MTSPGRKLPRPSRKGEVSLERVLAIRRSVREFADEPLTLRQLSQLSWSAQGITGSDEERAAPSAGALYPLELYVATADGLFLYDPQRHALHSRTTHDPRPAMCKAALSQEAVARAPAVFAIAAVYRRCEVKYGRRARFYVHLEAGHACQNLLLQAAALGLGGVPVAAFEDRALHGALDLPADRRPLYLIPVGRPG